MTAVSVLLRLLAAVACARAGGGGSFHSSGGSYGGSSGGSYGGSYGGYSSRDDVFFYVLSFWLQLTLDHPFFMLVPNAMIAYAVYLVWFAGNEYRVSRTIADGVEAQGDAAYSINLRKLKESDPAFDPPAFLERVKSMFMAIQAAWSSMDMKPARGFVSDGVMERFTLQLGMLRARGLRNELVNMKITDMSVVEYECTPFWDVAHVAIEAEALDQDVSLEDGSVVRAGFTQTFVEVWTFVRWPGVKTMPGRGAVEGQCPNCGATLQMIDGEQCSSCKSWLNSGEFDWVLCEITQQSEWSPRDASSDAPGYAELTQKDPVLNTRFLEDRAAVVFWRWQEALWTGKTDALRPVAADGLCASVKEEVESPKFFNDAAIGAVVTIACEVAQPLDRAHVVVRWSGTRCERTATGFTEDKEIYAETVFTLARASGVRTDSKAGLRSLRCASCGAPPRAREAWQCEYCGKPFNDGSRQWVLIAAVPAAEWKMPQGLIRAPVVARPDGQAPATEAPSDDGFGWTRRLTPDAALRVMTAAMMADGAIDPREQAYLVDFARSHGVAPETVSDLVQAAEEKRLELPVPQSTEESCAFLRGLVIMSLADGKVSAEERRGIDACAQALSLPKADVDDLIERERSAMYARAKDALARKKAAA